MLTFTEDSECFRRCPKPLTCCVTQSSQNLSVVNRNVVKIVFISPNSRPTAVFYSGPIVVDVTSPAQWGLGTSLKHLTTG